MVLISLKEVFVIPIVNERFQIVVIRLRLEELVIISYIKLPQLKSAAT